jgi:beta-mannosidase
MKHAVPGIGLFVYLLAMAAAGDAVAAARSGVTLHEGWTFRQLGREETYPAKMPGVVHLDLLQNDLIGDPFYRDYEQGLQWIGKTDWEYRTEFAVAPETLARRNVELVFDGLDTYAKVLLNGKEILDADNMYRRWRVAVAGKLKAKGNELRVVFRSPINEDLAKVTGSGYELPAVNDQGEKTSVYTRKAPYSFGWDWGPRFVTCGVWKPVRLEAWDDARIVDVAVRQKELGKDKATLTAEVEVVAAKPAAGTSLAATLEVTVEGGGAPVTAKVPLKTGSTTHTVAFEIASPKLWWPNGYGEQPLYTVKTRLLVAGQAVDESKDRIGLRTLERRRAKDEWGTSFEFVVNGVPVFAKGANWIPADSFLTRVTRERYAGLLRSAQDAHMNMLRVWGGGIYESDDFYELADEMGLLVWQDFHFSCSLYPADKEFLANVAVEAEEAIRRLRNHPSVALWNGNNEMEAGWFQWGWKERYPGWLWNDYKAIFHDLLPKAVAKFDPTRSYWPSSPSANLEGPPGDPGNGDMHYWGVWHGAEPFAAYERQRTRFMSEYGFQSFPEMKTIQSFAREGDLSIDSPVMMSHQKHPRGNQLIREYMLRDYREPKDFASFLYVSQVLQAEGIKLGAESLRRSRPQTMGSLYWQLNDCWPVASWASIDYFGRWKALQHYAKRFYAPVLVSTSEEDGQVGVHVVSDLTTPLGGVLEARLLDLSGAVLWEEKQPVTVDPLSSHKLLAVTKAKLLEGGSPGAVFLEARLVVDGKEAASNTRFFAPPKDMALVKPRIAVDVSPADGGFGVGLSSDTLARHVRLAYDADDGTFSDNYFDLVPGRPVEVIYRSKGPVDLEAFRKGLKVVSILDAY